METRVAEGRVPEWTDADLRGSDAASFSAWAQPHVRVLLAVAAREVGPNNAEDVVQEALLRAWQRRSTFAPERGSARAWLVGILLDRVRRSRNRGRRQGLDSDFLAPVSVEHIDARLDLETGIAALPRRQRQAVVLYYLADLSVDEVGHVLGISAGSVKKHLHGARSRLRTYLEGR